MTVPILISSDKPNLNGRIYPMSILHDIAEQINNHSNGFGTLNDNAGDNMIIIDAMKVSHRVSNAVVIDNILMVDIDILEEPPAGKLLKQIIDHVVFRPSGFGFVDDETSTVMEGYDFVSVNAILKSNDSFKNLL